MDFKDSLKITKLDLSKLIIIPLGGSSQLNSDFEIAPKTFLRFAKEDMQIGDDKGIINALSNAKRAIDCQIDLLLNNLGIDYEKIPKTLQPFIGCFAYDDDISYKLKIIQGLNLAPGFILSKCRNLRNRLEHSYKRPTISEVKETVDIADLLIKSIEGSYNNKLTEFSITDEDNLISPGNFEYKAGYTLEFRSDSFKGYIAGNQYNRIEFAININNPEFLGFVRLWKSFGDEYELLESMKIISSIINHPMPLKHIKIKEI